ncbi:MAG TPA: T9SS type A sorting domain-containing protein, partial [Bacteroidales bacterium]
IPEPWKRYMFIHVADWLEPGIYWQAEACWALGYFASEPDEVNIIEEKIDNESFTVYPNPISSELMIEMKENNEKLAFEIVNPIGQLVFKGNIIKKTIIPTSNFIPGVYIIKLKKSGKTFESRKIIKQ